MNEQQTEAQAEQASSRQVPDALKDLDVDQGRLPGWIYSDAEVRALEVERIFNRCWMFLAHESEIPNAGDFVTRELGNDSVVVARGADGVVRVLLNVCRHRGMKLCRSDVGNEARFRCPYHGWTYRNNGALIAIPYEKIIYDGRVDRSKLSLLAARCESYHGLIFGTWSPSAPTLRDYLGDMSWYVDLWAHRGEMEVIGPPQRWEVDLNWKIPSENFMSDAYHTSSAHGFSSRVGLVPSLDFAMQGLQIDAGGGHGLTLGLPAQRSIFPEEVLARCRGVLDEDQVGVLSQVINMPGTVFPNLSFLTSSFAVGGETGAFTTMRLFHPIGPTRTRISSWLLVERDTPDWWKQRCHRTYLLTFGASGTFEQDDMEIWSAITDAARGSQGRKVQHVLEMGRGKDPVEFVGPGLVFDGKFSEHNSRAYYRHWLSLVRGGGDRCSTGQVPAGVGGGATGWDDRSGPGPA